MELREVVTALEPASVDTDANPVFERVAVDPTKADSRTLFVCIEGFGLDGHDFAAEAVANGAVAVVAERRLDVGVPQVVVPDTRAALAVIADEFWRRPTEELRVVGVTGTSGKTTTAYLVHSILDRVRFAAFVFTNLGHDHLDFHGTRERYFDAKRRLFINGAPPAAVNVGDAYGRRLAAELARRGHERVTTFGLADEADVRPDELVLSPAGAHIRVGELTLATPLLGAHNVENVLAAVATARLVGASDDAICAGVARMGGVPGRMESVDAGQPFRVLVDYAHKPEALEAVLRTARAVTEGRVICVFGCG